MSTMYVEQGRRYAPDSYSEQQARQLAEEAEYQQRLEEAERIASDCFDRHLWREAEEILGVTWFRERAVDVEEVTREALTEALCEALSVPQRDRLYHVRALLREPYAMPEGLSIAGFYARLTGIMDSRLDAIASMVGERGRVAPPEWDEYVEGEG